MIEQLRNVMCVKTYEKKRAAVFLNCKFSSQNFGYPVYKIVYSYKSCCIFDRAGDVSMIC